MKTRVAHVLSSLALGGQERVALDLAASQAQAGFDVSVISLAAPPEGPLGTEFRQAGVGVETVGRGPGLQLRLPFKVGSWLRRRRIDLVHTHNRMALLYGATGGSMAGVAIIHTKHGANPTEGRPLVASRFAAHLIDAFVAVSPETAEVARRRHEVDEAKLSVINNGIDLSRFHRDSGARAEVRAALGIASDAWVVGTVGRLAAEKDQALFIRAAAPLLGAGAHLLLVGDGPLSAPLNDLARALGIMPYFHMLGTRSDVPRVLNAFDLFVLSSSTEGLPLVIPEAMATGLPVVSTAVGGIPTVVEEGQTGFLVPRGDERALRERLVRFLGQPELARMCGERARSAAVARFSAERMQREYLKLYEQVLTRRSERQRARRGDG